MPPWNSSGSNGSAIGKKQRLLPPDNIRHSIKKKIIMAQVSFQKGQPIQSLSGTVGNITFRTLNGRTYMFQKPDPVLPEHPTRQQREQYKRRTIINDCLTIIQSQITDLQEAITERPKIKERLRYLYKSFAPTVKAPTKLQRKILSEYNARFSATSTRRSRVIHESSPTRLHS